MKVCSVDGCDRQDRIKRDLCHKHYEYMRIHGTAIFVRPRQHGTLAGYWQHWRRSEDTCQSCHAAFMKYQNERRKKDPEKFRLRAKDAGYSRRRYAAERDEVLKQMRESTTRLQAMTATAPRNGYEWTGPELELLLTRDDLSNFELARHLGRTYYATCSKRNQLKREQETAIGETRSMRLAGVPKQPGTGEQVHSKGKKK